LTTKEWCRDNHGAVEHDFVEEIERRRHGALQAVLEQKDAAPIRAHLIKRANEDKVSGAK
jgi:hypothetical protein